MFYADHTTDYYPTTTPDDSIPETAETWTTWADEWEEEAAIYDAWGATGAAANARALAELCRDNARIATY